MPESRAWTCAAAVWGLCRAGGGWCCGCARLARITGGLPLRRGGGSLQRAAPDALA